MEFTAIKCEFERFLPVQTRERGGQSPLTLKKRTLRQASAMSICDLHAGLAVENLRRTRRIRRRSGTFESS